MVEIIIYFLFILLIFVGISRKSAINGNILPKESTLYLRGLFAIEILVGHIGQITENLFLLPFEKAMICSVGMFFLFSGYGLSYSYQTKEGYFKNYKKRIFAILVPTFYCGLLVCIIHKFQVQIFDVVNWYIIELLLFYGLFYIFFRYLKQKYAVLGITITTVLIVTIFFFCNVHKAWYVSALCFPLGIIIHTYENSFSKLINKYYKLLVCIFCILFCISSSCIFIPSETFFSVVIARNVSTITFSILIIILLSRISIGNNLLRLLGTISFEIYIYHIALMKPLWNIISNLPIYIMILLVLTICLAWIMKKINDTTIKIISKDEI